MRQEVRRRVAHACKHELKAAPIVCAYYDLIVVRESSGRASVRHVKGKNENGLGAMGISVRWHADKWPGKDEDPALCTPEVSLVVAHAIVWRAFTKYHARSLTEFQAIYGGRWACWHNPDIDARQCRADPNGQTIRAVCSRAEGRGFNCETAITKRDLGLRIPLGERRAWVERVTGQILH